MNTYKLFVIKYYKPGELGFSLFRVVANTEHNAKAFLRQNVPGCDIEGVTEERDIDAIVMVA